jgi:hypothetical protein
MHYKGAGCKPESEDYMKTYTIRITETNVCFVQVEALDEDDAEDIARQMYNDDDDYIDEHISTDEGGVEFDIVDESEN